MLRDVLIQEVEDEVDAGRLTNWSQWRELLEPYDEHKPIEEGLSGAAVKIVADALHADENVQVDTDPEAGENESNDEAQMEEEDGEPDAKETSEVVTATVKAGAEDLMTLAKRQMSEAAAKSTEALQKAWA